MPARSYLFVPADRPERMGKALAAGADCVIIDLEDAVPTAHKALARDTLAAWLAQAAADTQVAVRINAAGTPWFDDDLRACRHPAVSQLMLPKAESAEALAAVAAALPSAALLPLVESAAGLAAAAALAGAPGVQRLAFGSIDFALDLGLDGEDEAALLAFRSQLVLASRLAGLAPPVDGVSTALDDPVALARDATHARRLGFGAKLCIHPRQVATVNTAFTPSADEQAWARRVLQAAAAAGGAAVAVDGRMVDRPVLLRAQAVLRQAGVAP